MPIKLDGNALVAVSQHFHAAYQWGGCQLSTQAEKCPTDAVTSCPLGQRNQAFPDHGAPNPTPYPAGTTLPTQVVGFPMLPTKDFVPSLTTGTKTAKTVVSIPKSKVPITSLRFWKSGFVGAQSADCESSFVDTPNFSPWHSLLAAVCVLFGELASLLPHGSYQTLSCSPTSGQ